jgi:2-amino-4-hydroxy-6-hydroxymethyldihydropteridine diphosphokinase
VTTAVLAFGSNLGDRVDTISKAVRRVAEVAGVELVAASSLLETDAVTAQGVDVEAPRYLNSIAIVETILEPEQLLRELHAIEESLGRVRGERWADRTLDIDIVTFGTLETSTETLTLPHPRAAERTFVLAPWLELDADARLPGLGRVDELLAHLLERTP